MTVSEAVMKKLLEGARDKLPAYQLCSTPESGAALSESLSKCFVKAGLGVFLITKIGKRELKKLKGAPVVSGRASTNSLILPLSQEVVDRFWAKVKTGSSDECWPWTGSTDGHGYGQISIQRFPRKATRIALILDGRNPGNLCALHKCDNPPCCNPGHLYVGTKLENSTDMVRRRRHQTDPARGEKHYASKITEEVVREIRRRAERGELQRSIADSFGIDRTMVSKIVLRKNWRHIP
jgi:hypothetical protein